MLQQSRKSDKIQLFLSATLFLCIISLNAQETEGGPIKRIVDAVIFDLDGTITDTEKYYQITWKEALAHFGYKAEPWMTLDLRSLGRPYVSQTLKEWFGEDLDFEEVYAYCHVLTDKIIAERGISLKPGAIEILNWLKSENITAAIATSNGYSHASAKLKKAGLEGFFDRVICADMVTFGKPAPDTYLYACKELGLAPERTFAVEDSPNGVCSAYGAGCKVIMVPDLTEPDDELKKLLFARVDRLADIKKLA